MTWLKTFACRLLALFKRKELEAELQEEVRFHLEMETQENIRRGMTPEDAEYAARRTFGGVDRAMEQWRDRRWLPQVDQWAQDVRFGARNLSRSPGFVAFAVASLALGIGVNTAIFTLIRALVLDPLPYPDPAGLVKLWESITPHGESTYGSVSVPNLRDWRERNQVFEDVAAFTVEGANLADSEGTTRVLSAQVEPGVFPIMGVKPLFGRTFLPHENVHGRDRVVVLGYRLWQERFGADPAVVGRRLNVNGAAHVVVGVMPEGFQFPPRSPAEFWTPLVFKEAWQEDRGSHWVQVIARLKPGVSWRTAAVNMREVGRQLEREHPLFNTARSVTVQPLHPATVAATAEVLMVLAGAVGAVLLLGCANVAHLVLARAAGRRRELGVRISLGSGRWRIVRMLTVESLLLAALGGIAGFYVGQWCLAAFLAFAADQIPAGVTVTPDASALWFCALVSLVSAVFAGLIPAVRVSRIDVQSALKEAGSSTGTALRRSRNVLMIWEVALALVLSVGALLLIRSLSALNHLDLGFQPERILTMKIALPDTRYSKADQTLAFHDGLLERVRGIPGVASAGMVSFLPVQFCCANRTFTIQGGDPPAPGHEPTAEFRVISPGYLQTMGIPLLAGRHLAPEDRAGSPGVVLISRQTAERYFPGRDPVGRAIRFGAVGRDEGWATVVGVVGDVRDRGVYQPASTVMYAPFGQTEWPWRSMSLVLRSGLDPGQLATTVRRLVSDKDPDAAVFLVKTMDAVVSDSVARTRLLSRLLTVFGALALVLAVVGVYGVMSHLVSQRTHELGVRIALGASRGEIFRLVLGRGLRNAAVGIMLGLACTVAVTISMRHFVIGVGGVDVWTYVIAALGVTGVAIAASYVPAWRASRVDPLAALRDE